MWLIRYPLFNRRKVLTIRTLLEKTFMFASLLSFLFLFPLSTSAGNKEASIEEIVVTNSDKHLMLYFKVVNCFTEEMNKAINNGINTTFTFFIRLAEVKDWQLNEEIADLRISHSIRYDSLKKIYNVTLEEQNNRTVAIQDFEKAKALMSELSGLKVTRLENLRKTRRYQIQMMAELDKVRLPFYLHNVFFFLSLWDFQTKWYKIDFRY
jgi:hypothetical protein